MESITKVTYLPAVPSHLSVHMHCELPTHWGAQRSAGKIHSPLRRLPVCPGGPSASHASTLQVPLAGYAAGWSTCRAQRSGRHVVGAQSVLVELTNEHMKTDWIKVLPLNLPAV